jgi:hypothetical protein
MFIDHWMHFISKVFLGLNIWNVVISYGYKYGHRCGYDTHVHAYTNTIHVYVSIYMYVCNVHVLTYVCIYFDIWVVYGKNYTK